MPSVYPFPAIQFAPKAGSLSDLIAPPYDVLDNAGKAALLARNSHNIVAIDLPHTPAKELGPPSAYESAAARLREQLASGTLARRATPAMFAYRQTFVSEDGRTFQRCGMACCVDVVPFGPRAGGGILPHEQTFSGPKEDRFALMKATRTQLSPIFGLHADEAGRATRLVREVMAKRPADMRASMGQPGHEVAQELWAVDDAPTIKAYQDALAGEDVFIADGHHRYTTGLNYLAHLEQQAGGTGKLPANHPARKSMIVLVSMSDPGLVIWPTHRVLGGMKDYALDAFLAAGKDHFRAAEVPGGLAALDKALADRSDLGEMRFGIYDVKTAKGLIATPTNSDPLASEFPSKPRAWRQLVVAYCQHVIVEQICQPRLNAGQAVKWAFPHTIPEVESIAKGVETGAGGGAGFAQLAIIVRPTPLASVRDVSRANELMPQKSTFFYPKLATGLFLHGLE